MRKIYTYIVIISALTSITSCVIDHGDYRPDMKKKAVVVCESTIGVINDYMTFLDIGLVLDEYLMTPDEYKPLILDTYLRQWRITPVGENWSIEVSGRRYYVYPGDKSISEIGAEWRITRLQYSYSMEIEASYDECTILCNAENSYEVGMGNIISMIGTWTNDNYTGDADFIVSVSPRGENRFLFSYEVEISGEYIVSRTNWNTSAKEEVLIEYTLEGSRGTYAQGYYYKSYFVSATAEIESGKVGTPESERDNITVTLSGDGNIHNLNIVHNGEEIEYSGYAPY